MELFQSKLTTKAYDNFENQNFRTHPSQHDYKLINRILERSFYIRNKSTHEIIPCFSYLHKEGLVCAVYSDRDDCIKRSKEFEVAYEIQTEVLPISGLWEFFNKSALDGCVGAVLDDEFALRFFNRLTDLDRSLPTIINLRIPNAENTDSDLFFGKRGIIDFEPGRTIKWNNYEKSDKVCCKYLIFDGPLPDNQLTACIISRTDNEMCLYQGADTFLGPYISIEGAVAVFSDSTLAHHFAGEVDLLADSTHSKLKHNFEIIPVKLFDLLDHCASTMPFTDIVLNPTYHRAFQGQFFKNNSKWVLHTVSGVWDITEIAPKKLESYDLPKGFLGAPDDSLLAIHGIHTQVQYPFKRVTGADKSLFTPEDADDLIAEELNKFHEPLHIEQNQIPPADSFCIDAFDKVSGERYAFSCYDNTCNDLGFLVFPDVLCAISYISNTLLEIDENARLNGYRLCDGSGAPGSNNELRERNITSDMRIALKKIALDALTMGYTPRHSALIKKLMQDASATCEIIECGYFGDFLYYDLSDGNEVESRVSEIYEDVERSIQNKILGKIAKSRSKLQQNRVISEEHITLLRSSLGSAFEELTPDSVSIAVTALEEISNIGKRTNYDYAGISMKVAKIFERELTIRVFRAWRSNLINKFDKEDVNSILERNGDDKIGSDKLLVDYFSKKRKTDLGGMRFALNALKENVNYGTVTKSFSDFVFSLQEPGWLLSDEFSQILSDISSKYRNGGVHEHMVDFVTCQDAITRVITGENNALTKLIKATRQLKN